MGLIFTSTARFADLKRRVMDYDPAQIASAATDLCFDFSSNDAFYGGLPADGAAITSGVLSLAIQSAGSNGVNGTYPLLFTGGDGFGAAGTATVSGNKITAVALTNPGSGYTSSPVVTIPGSGLISATVNVVMASLRNLARDVNPVLGRTGRVYGVWNVAAQRPIRQNNGLRSNPGTYDGIEIRKEGVANNRVGEPALEGFLDQLLLTTFRATDFASGASPLMMGRGDGSNQYGGWGQSSTAGAYGLRPGAYTAAGWTDGVRAGALVQFGYVARFNVAANTTMLYLIRDGALRSTAIAGVAPASYITNLANAAMRINGGGASGGGVLNGVAHRTYRELIGLNGLTNDEAAAKAAREWAYSLAKFGA